MADGSNKFRCSKYSRIIFLKQHLFKTKFSVPALTLYLILTSPQNKGAWRYTFLKKGPDISKFVTLLLEIPEKTSFHPWQIVWEPVEVPYDFYMNAPENSTSFLTDPWNFCIGSSRHSQITCAQFPLPAVWIFFWNSLFQVVLILNFTFEVFYCHGAIVTLEFQDSVLVFSYLFCLSLF